MKYKFLRKVLRYLGGEKIYIVTQLILLILIKKMFIVAARSSHPGCHSVVTQWNNTYRTLKKKKKEKIQDCISKRILHLSSKSMLRNICVIFKKLNTKVLRASHQVVDMKVPGQCSMRTIAPEDLPVQGDAERKDSGVDRPDPGRPKLMYVFILVFFKFRKLKKLNIKTYRIKI